jgi:hypothetical protein
MPPELDKVEFEFPDEIEEKEAKAKAKEEEKFEDEDIEVVAAEPDPKLAPAPAPDEVTEEELNKYSDKRLKERLAHLGRGYHDAKREAENALRDREEAIRLAESVAEENRKLKGSLSQGQTALLEQAKKVVANEVEEAKRKYKMAYESGDPDALVAAQEELTTAKIKADKVNNFKPAPLQEEKTEVQPRQIAREPQIDQRAQAWQAKNEWFGKDREMTGFALALHEKLVVEDGVDPTSDEYYKRLNGRIRQVFPEKFASDEPADAQPSQRQPKANVVAPATRSTAPKKIVLEPRQVQLAKRLGIPLELYAKKVAEQERKLS